MQGNVGPPPAGTEGDLNGLGRQVEESGPCLNVRVAFSRLHLQHAHPSGTFSFLHHVFQTPSLFQDPPLHFRGDATQWGWERSEGQGQASDSHFPPL